MLDFEKIKTLYNLGKGISLSDVQELVQSAKRKSYAVGEYLIKEGAVKKDAFFIRKGLVRVFRVNDRGDEITTALRWENHIATSPDTLLFDQPSRSYYQALEPTEVYGMDFELLDAIVSKNPKLEANRRHFLRRELKQALQRIESFVLLSPEERYLAFITANPDIDNRVPNKYIANVLGITPVSLSRIRKRIAERKK